MQPNADSPSKTLLVAVTTLVLFVWVPGTVAGATSAAETHARPQQVGVNVTDIGAGLAVGGDVDGNATVVAGRVGAAGQVGGNASIVLGPVDFDVSAFINASVGTGVGDVLDTGTAEGRVMASVTGLGRTYDVARNATLPTVLPDTPDTRRAARAPGAGGTQLVAIVAPAGGVFPPGQAAPGDWFTVSFWDLYGFMVNLVLGLVLVGVFPAFSRRVVAEVVDDPSRAGLFGIAVLVVTPIVLLLFALSLFAIPMALVGGLLFLVLSWVGAIYGRFLVGAWLLDVVPHLLSYAGVERSRIENRWAALFAGLIVVGLLIRIPYLGRFVDLVVLALGVGAIGQIVYGTYRRTERAESAGAVPSSDSREG